MSMNFSEFKRRLGADPRRQDPEFLRARESSPEFRQAAAEADRFESRLERAVGIGVPASLLDDLRSIPEGTGAGGGHEFRWPLALAASLLIAIGAAGVYWKLDHHWDTVEDYVVDHYRHDGGRVLSATGDEAEITEDLTSLLAEFGVRATPEFAAIVSVVKKCPTPDGKGVHMVLSTKRGLVTVIYMPGTAVEDGAQFAFDDREAILVALPAGSAAIIGAPPQHVAQLHPSVQQSILPVNRNT